MLLEQGSEIETAAMSYMMVTASGFLFIIRGAGLLTRVIRYKLKSNVFNKQNETFPQEERLLTNEYSINLPAIYQLKGKMRNSWINFINPRRGLLIMGSPGSGKSWFIVENIIRQLIEKKFAEFIFDFKYPELTEIAYNHYLKHRSKYPISPKFYSVNFTNLDYSNRNNPLFPELMQDLLDAMDASKTMLLSINKTWINRQGEFFVESPQLACSSYLVFKKISKGTVLYFASCNRTTST